MHAVKIPLLGIGRQVDLCDFEHSLFYILSFKTAKAMLTDPVSKHTNKTLESFLDPIQCHS